MSATLVLMEALIASGRFQDERAAMAHARQLIGQAPTDEHTRQGTCRSYARTMQTRPDVLERMVTLGAITADSAATHVAVGGGLVHEVAQLLRLEA